MNHSSKHKRLLSHVLAEESDAAFREALLGQTLRLVRRRKFFRKARRTTYACALVAGLALLGSHLFRDPNPARPAFASKPYTLVQTQPLANSAIIITTASASATIVASTPSAEIVTTSSARREFHQLTDEELLALVPSPVLLVRHLDQSAELVFTNPDDREAFLQN